MKLIQLYRDILDALGFETSPEGHVSTVSYSDKGRETMPTLVDGDRLVIPTDHMLGIDNREFIMFHPMWEDPYKGPTIVSEFIRKAISVRLDNSLALLLIKIFTLAVNVEDQKHLKPEQAELLDLAKTADGKTLDNIVRLISATSSSDRTRSFTHLYVKRGGELEGRKFSQVGIMTFPLYEAILAAADKRKVLGVQLRVADYNNLLQVMEYILPNIGTPNAYSYGSESMVSPRLESMMGAFYNVYDRIARIESLFDLTVDDLPDYVNSQTFPMNWTTFVGRTHEYQTDVARIPQQRGGEQKEDATKAGFNTTNVGPITGQVATQPAQPATTTIPAPPVMQQPQQPQQPQQVMQSPYPVGQAPVQDNAGWLIQPPAGQTPPAPQATQPTVQQPVMQQPMMVNQMGQPVYQPMQPVQPNPATTDVNSAINNSLGLSAQMNNAFNGVIGNVTPQMQQQMLQQQQMLAMQQAGQQMGGIGTFNVPIPGMQMAGFGIQQPMMAVPAYGQPNPLAQPVMGGYFR